VFLSAVLSPILENTFLAYPKMENFPFLIISIGIWLVCRHILPSSQATLKQGRLPITSLHDGTFSALLEWPDNILLHRYN
jgi:hypothetical protein